jgi:hypothetical protein
MDPHRLLAAVKRRWSGDYGAEFVKQQVGCTVPEMIWLTAAQQRLYCSAEQLQANSTGMPPTGSCLTFRSSYLLLLHFDCCLQIAIILLEDAADQDFQDGFPALGQKIVARLSRSVTFPWQLAVQTVLISRALAADACVVSERAHLDVTWTAICGAQRLYCGRFGSLELYLAYALMLEPPKGHWSTVHASSSCCLRAKVLAQQGCFVADLHLHHTNFVDCWTTHCTDRDWRVQHGLQPNTTLRKLLEGEDGFEFIFWPHPSIASAVKLNVAAVLNGSG